MFRSCSVPLVLKPPVVESRPQLSDTIVWVGLKKEETEKENETKRETETERYRERKRLKLIAYPL